jgi:hypothetical protein
MLATKYFFRLASTSGKGTRREAVDVLARGMLLAACVARCSLVGFRVAILCRLRRCWRRLGGMDARDRLQTVLYRVRLSAAELRLQPEYFQATALLDQSAGDLSDVLAQLPMPQGAALQKESLTDDPHCANAGASNRPPEQS